MIYAVTAYFANIPCSPLTHDSSKGVNGVVVCTLRLTRSESSKLSIPGWYWGYATPTGPSKVNTQWISPAGLGGPGPEESASCTHVSVVPARVCRGQQTQPLNLAKTRGTVGL